MGVANRGQARRPNGGSILGMIWALRLAPPMAGVQPDRQQLPHRSLHTTPQTESVHVCAGKTAYPDISKKQRGEERWKESWQKKRGLNETEEVERKCVNESKRGGRER